MRVQSVAVYLPPNNFGWGNVRFEFSDRIAFAFAFAAPYAAANFCYFNIATSHVCCLPCLRFVLLPFKNHCTKTTMDAIRWRPSTVHEKPFSNTRWSARFSEHTKKKKNKKIVVTRHFVRSTRPNLFLSWVFCFSSFFLSRHSAAIKYSTMFFGLLLFLLSRQWTPGCVKFMLKS